MSPLKIQKSGAHAAGDFSLQFSGIEKYSLCRAIMPRPGQEAKYLYIGLQQKGTISSWILKIIHISGKRIKYESRLHLCDFLVSFSREPKLAFSLLFSGSGSLCFRL